MLDDAQLSDIVTPVVERAGLTVYDVEFRGSSLVVMVQGPEGFGVDELAEVSRSISRQLDEDDPIPGTYTLEVSTPGLERRLRTPEHFAGAVDADVKIKLAPGVEGDRRADGVLVAADDTTVTIRFVDGTERTVDIADIDRARTYVDWTPAPKPGKGPKTPKPGKQPKAATNAETAESPTVEPSDTAAEHTESNLSQDAKGR